MAAIFALSALSSAFGETVANEDTQVVRTHFYNLLITSTRLDEWWPKWSRRVDGGAIAMLGDDLLVVSPWGAFGLVDSRGETAKVDGRVPMNVRGVQAESQYTPMRLDRFRVAGVLLRRRSDTRWDLFITHHHFVPLPILPLFPPPPSGCVGFRLSAATITRDGSRISVGGWRNVFDIGPCFPPSAWVSGQAAAGEMVADGPAHLLVAVGDAGVSGNEYAHAASRNAPRGGGPHLGKLVRVATDTGGTTILAAGLRVPGGLARDRDGNLWEVEHGPFGGDELNLLLPGENYGWPQVSYGINYDRTANRQDAAQSGRHEGFAKPVFAWVPSVATSGIAINDERSFPMWRDDLLIVTLKGGIQRLRRDATVVRYAEQIVAAGTIRRPRDIAQLPDGRMAVLAAKHAKVYFLRRFSHPYCDRDSREKRHIYASGCPRFPSQNARSQDASAVAATGAELYEAHCRACHDLRGGKHGDGPHLVDLMGRPVGSIPGYAFSSVLGQLNDIAWSPSTLAWFLADPGRFAPGTSMPNSKLEHGEISAIVDFIESARGGARGE